jgi:hypothetical protein
MGINTELGLARLMLPLVLALGAACTPAHIQASDGATDSGTGGVGGAVDGQGGGQGGAGVGGGGLGGASQGMGGAPTDGGLDLAGNGTGGQTGGGGAGTGGVGGGAGSADSVDASMDAGGDGACGVSCGPSTFRVLRLGDGNAALSSAAAAVFIEERRLDGTLLNAIPLPTLSAGNGHPLTMSGTAVSEGALSLSADGQFLTLAGYSAPPGTAAVASSAAAIVPRVVARIDGAGLVDTSTVLVGAFDGNNVRSATSLDGTGFWAAGAGSSTGGVWFIPLGAMGGVRVLVNPTSVRLVNVFGGQLYGSSNSGTFADVFAIGSGLPVTAAQATPLAGMSPTGAASPFAFVFFDRSAAVAGVDTLYVADDRAPPIGGIQKWVFDGTTWTLVATFSVSQNPSGFRGLTGFASPAGVTLIGSTAELSANRLVVLVDDDVTPPSPTVIATAAPSMIMKGVSLSPGYR